METRYEQPARLRVRLATGEWHREQSRRYKIRRVASDADEDSALDSYAPTHILRAARTAYYARSKA